MKPVYPDLSWYMAISDRRKVTGRCPFASVQGCPRHFETTSLLSEAGTTTKMPVDLHDRVLAKWQAHNAWPATVEAAASIAGSDGHAHSYSNFCPEVAYDTFRLFATTLIRFGDDIDRADVERAIEADGLGTGNDWRWNWQHVEPMHYTECPVYAKLYEEKPMAEITFNAPICGQVNVAGTSISSPVMQLSVGDLLAKIDASDASAEEKEAAKSKLAGFLSHPLVTSIVGGLAGGAVGLVT
jgi:hypothetical protein